MRFLLLQVRAPGDPMASAEQAAFRRALGVGESAVRPFDLLSGAPTPQQFAEADAVLIGGSGDYSVVRGGPWLPAALRAMETLYETAKPTFASCWGFQALARALGGRVVTDHARAEVGVLPLRLTEAGRRDPVFSPLGTPFHAVIGHEDIVDELPPGAVSLVSSATLPNEAFTFPGKPIYATQFHPELDREDLVARLAAYPPYLKLAGAATLEEFRNAHPETADTASLLRRFAARLAATDPDAVPP